jgi:hypothetical protein
VCLFRAQVYGQLIIAFIDAMSSFVRTASALLAP